MIYLGCLIVVFFGLILFGIKGDYEVETCEKEGHKNY